MFLKLWANAVECNTGLFASLCNPSIHAYLPNVVHNRLQLFERLVNGLQLLTGRGIGHADLSDENVLVEASTKNGHWVYTPVLIDWYGAADAAQSARPPEEHLAGFWSAQLYAQRLSLLASVVFPFSLKKPLSNLVQSANHTSSSKFTNWVTICICPEVHHIFSRYSSARSSANILRLPPKVAEGFRLQLLQQLMVNNLGTPENLLKHLGILSLSLLLPERSIMTSLRAL